MQHCPDTESQWVLATAGHHPFTAIEELDENDEGIPINRNHRKKRYGIAIKVKILIKSKLLLAKFLIYLYRLYNICKKVF